MHGEDGPADHAVPQWDSEAALAFLEAAPKFRSTAVVAARRLTEQTSWVTARGSRLRGEAGDWLLSDGVEEWTIAPEIFAATYAHDSDGHFRKTAIVRARRLESSIDVMTREGVSRADAGDWLVCNPDGDFWPVPAGVFRQRYAAV